MPLNFRNMFGKDKKKPAPADKPQKTKPTAKPKDGGAKPERPERPKKEKAEKPKKEKAEKPKKEKAEKPKKPKKNPAPPGYMCGAITKYTKSFSGFGKLADFRQAAAMAELWPGPPANLQHGFEVAYEGADGRQHKTFAYPENLTPETKNERTLKDAIETCATDDSKIPKSSSVPIMSQDKTPVPGQRHTMTVQLSLPVFVKVDHHGHPTSVQLQKAASTSLKKFDKMVKSEKKARDKHFEAEEKATRKREAKLDPKIRAAERQSARNSI